MTRLCTQVQVGKDQRVVHVQIHIPVLAVECYGLMKCASILVHEVTTVVTRLYPQSPMCRAEPMHFRKPMWGRPPSAVRPSKARQSRHSSAAFGSPSEQRRSIRARPILDPGGSRESGVRMQPTA